MKKKPTKKQQEEALKAALKEWLDDQFAVFGKWTMRTIFAAIFTVIVHAVLAFYGYRIF